LTVDARIDRVDELESGGHVILDYKTGRASIVGWADERLDEPQLPLYAISVPGDVAAVSLVTVSAQEVAYRGLARADDLLPDVTTPAQEKNFAADWATLLDGWRSSLDALAGEFLAGHAAVAPKHYPRTCEYCDLGTLCRVKELLDRGPVAVGETADE
jgi:RecB family exonuclease